MTPKKIFDSLLKRALEKLEPKYQGQEAVRLRLEIKATLDDGSEVSSDSSLALSRMVYEPGTHTDFATVVSEIKSYVKSHPEHTIVSADDPLRGAIGWAALDSETQLVSQWTLHVSDLVKTLPDPLRDCFKTATSRSDWTKLLNDREDS